MVFLFSSFKNHALKTSTEATGTACGDRAVDVVEVYQFIVELKVKVTVFVPVLKATYCKLL